METERIKCPGCGYTVETELQDFVDAAETPQAKEKIKSGEFFLVECPQCGEKTFAEHPLMYTDSSKKLHIYLAPEHDEELLKELNGIGLPEELPAADGIFRVVSDGAALLEKIMIFDAGRDDRVMELYKAMAFEMLKEDWPKMSRENLLYASDDRQEYIIVWDYVNAAGEQLTVEFDEELYEHLKADYGAVLSLPGGEYAEVDARWLSDRIDVE